MSIEIPNVPGHIAKTTPSYETKHDTIEPQLGVEGFL
jgi:hypothetical protein